MGTKMPLAGEQAGASGAGSGMCTALGEYPLARRGDGPPSTGALTPSEDASQAWCNSWQLVAAPGALVELPSDGASLSVVGRTEIGSRLLASRVNLMMADQSNRVGDKLIPPVNRGGMLAAILLPSRHLESLAAFHTEQHGPSVSLDPASVSLWPGRRMGTAGHPASLAQGRHHPACAYVSVHV